MSRKREWIVEEKSDGEWKEVRCVRGENGPKAQPGQRVKCVKKREQVQRARKKALSNPILAPSLVANADKITEISDILGFK